MSRPIIGRDHYARPFAARTSIEAFGTPFVVQKRRAPTIDEVIGAACVAVIVGIVAAWMAGVIR